MRGLNFLDWLVKRTLLAKALEIVYAIVPLGGVRSRWERSRLRWRMAKPTLDLTWWQPVEGGAFVEKMVEYGAFEPGKRLLEIGPGYGRLLAAITERGYPFGTYLGIDISRDVVQHLRQQYVVPGVEFLEGDVEVSSFQTTFDTVFASLVFKHFYPTFERAALHVRQYMNPESLLLFDLRESSKRWVWPGHFEAHSSFRNYIRDYNRTEVRRILDRAGFLVVAIDTVWHTPDHPRLFVVARPKKA